MLVVAFFELIGLAGLVFLIIMAITIFFGDWNKAVALIDETKDEFKGS